MGAGVRRDASPGSQVSGAARRGAGQLGSRFVIDGESEARGYARTQLRWPRGEGRRPPLLGDALAQLRLPDEAGWDEVARALTTSPRDKKCDERGGTPMIALDTETTGVGQSSGTIAFLIGAAWFEGEALRVEQWTLTRLSAEAAMLRDFAERLEELAGPSTVLLSYNGASFDLPLLRARCRRARVESPVLEARHVDLLLPVRRLWRDVEPDCRLSTLERSRLGVFRHDDVAGHEIPDAFWGWLEDPDDGDAAALIERVHVHNQVDLLTLPALAVEVAAAIRSPSGSAEALRVARLEVARGARDVALRALEPWLPPLEDPQGGEALRELLLSVTEGDEAGAAEAPRRAPTRSGAPSAGGTSPRPSRTGQTRGHALGGVGERMARLGVVAPGRDRTPAVTRLRAGERPLAGPSPSPEPAGTVRGAQPRATLDRSAPPSPQDRQGADVALRREALDRSAPLSTDHRQLWALAAKLLRRGGDDALSAVLWARICLRIPGDPEAHEALAKLVEHRLGELLGSGAGGWSPARTLSVAIAVTRASSAPSPRRLARLRDKLAKHSRAEPDSVYG